MSLRKSREGIYGVETSRPGVIHVYTYTCTYGPTEQISRAEVSAASEKPGIGGNGAAWTFRPVHYVTGAGTDIRTQSTCSLST